MIDGAWLVNFVKDNLLALVPMRVVKSFERGVRFRKGIPAHRLWLKPNAEVPGEVPPGIRWFLPFFESIEVDDVVPAVIDLPMQSVTSLDKQPITFSVNITYEVTDIVAKYTQVSDFDASLIGAAKIHLAQKVRDWTVEELLKNQRDLEKSLKDTLTTKVKKWGVKITDVGITDLVVVRTYRLLNEQTYRS
jgi:regulator of protease activity HflC (stomatin/prohibitin superfamily)